MNSLVILMTSSTALHDRDDMMRLLSIARVSLLKTIVINFRLLPFFIAVKFPIIVSRNVSFQRLNGVVKIDSPVFLGMIRIGFGDLPIKDFRYDRSLLDLTGKIVFSGSANFGISTRISVSGTLSIGNNFRVSGGSTIICRKKVVFGNDVLISWDVLVCDTDFHQILAQSGERINSDRTVSFGDRIWLGARSTILKGVHIPDGVVVGAGSIISKPILQSKSVVVAEGKIIRTDIEWRD